MIDFAIVTKLIRTNCLGFIILKLNNVAYVVVWGGGAGLRASKGDRPVVVVAMRVAQLLVRKETLGQSFFFVER